MISARFAQGRFGMVIADAGDGLISISLLFSRAESGAIDVCQ
jgi:hypothetical protein